MEELSGLRQEGVVRKSCLPEFVISDVSNTEEQYVKISGSDGNKIEVKKAVQM